MSRLGWPPWASLLALVPLALAAGSRMPIGALPVGATAAAFFVLDAVRRRTWAERAAALDAAAIVALGTVAGYAMATGNPPTVDVPTTLAWVLLLGTPAVAWATALPEAGAGGGRLAARLRTLRWDRALALGTVILGVALAKCTWAFEAAILYTWLVASFSYWPLFLLCVLCLPEGRIGRVTSVLALVLLLTAAVWDFASTEVVLALAEPLTWPDLVARFEDPASVHILAEGLRSWRALLLVLGVFGGFAVLSWLLGRIRPGASGWTLARMIGFVLAAGQLLIRGQAVIEPRLAQHYAVPGSAPWSPVHVRPDYEQRLDLEKAREVRRAIDPPVWEDGPAEPFPGIAGRYVGRSVVVVVLESHRASDIARLGEGALGHSPSSPRLSTLADRGLLFTSYYQAHHPTHSALWALLTGLPYSGGLLKPVYNGPEAARLGRIPDFAALGYQCDWICPNSTKFDNWDRLMQSAGARFWILPTETEGLAHTYWTAWGLPDEQLMEVARRRFEAVTSTGRPLFLGVLTISNHSPYRFPDEIDGVPLSHDLHGGMRYADHALGQLVDALYRLPEERRPIVFATADTAASEGLIGAEPMGVANLEGIRIPGLLLLPDGALAGEAYEGLFGHEDLLDLLYLLVAPRVSSPKLVHRHRAVVSTTNAILTPTSYFDVLGGRFYEIRSRWKLHLVEDPPDRARLLAARAHYDRVRSALWRGAADPGVPTTEE